MYDLLDFVIIFSGMYLAYAAITMKRNGEIMANVVLNQSIKENAIKDKQGFIDYIYGKLILIGVIIMLSGIANMINSYNQGSSLINLLTLLVFAGALVAYGMVTKAALQKFM
ncbi:MAG: hypothetical protein J1E98_14830 [Lachnospiraceae bacterium]|nr:hypothetical protein [Lachnospiraceae bacterium]